MKEGINHQDRPVGEDCLFKCSLCLLLMIVSFFSFPPSHAQCMRNNKVFHDGERVEFNLYYKWGILMTKGGKASMTFTTTDYETVPAWRSELLLSSSGMLDKVFRIRDTIINYTTREHPRLLFSTKRANEKGRYQIDNLTYTYKGDSTYVHAFRRDLKEVKADTILVGGNCVLDIVGCIVHARSFDWNDMVEGQPYYLQVAMGKNVIPISYRYEGQRIVEWEDTKYSTRYLVVDIYDDVFTQNKEALEIWLGDDRNKLPIKVRAKLRIGAMEAYYKDSSGLRYPLDSRIVIK